MLELLLTSRGGIYFPDSGPGPKVLAAGTPEAGFFGFVTEEDLGMLTERVHTTMEQYAASVPASSLMRAAPRIWSKVFSDGRVYYIPDSPLYTSIRSRTIIDAGFLRRDNKMFYLATSKTTNASALTAKQGRFFAVNDSGKRHVLSVAGVDSTLPSAYPSTRQLIPNSSPELKAVLIARGLINLPVISESGFAPLPWRFSSVSVTTAMLDDPFTGDNQSDTISGYTRYFWYAPVSSSTMINPNVGISLSNYDVAYYPDVRLEYSPVVRLEEGYESFPIEPVIFRQATSSATMSTSTSATIEVDRGVRDVSGVRVVGDANSLQVTPVDTVTETFKYAGVIDTHAQAAATPEVATDAVADVIVDKTFNQSEQETTVVDDAHSDPGLLVLSDTAQPIEVSSSNTDRLTKPVVISYGYYSCPEFNFQKV